MDRFIKHLKQGSPLENLFPYLVCLLSMWLLLHRWTFSELSGVCDVVLCFLVDFTFEWDISERSLECGHCFRFGQSIRKTIDSTHGTQNGQSRNA